MINRKVDEAVFELLLTHAFRDAYARETERAEAEGEACPAPSAAHRRQEKRYYRRKRRGTLRVSTVLARTAACLLAFMGIGFGAMLFSQPVRAAVWDTVITVFEKYFVFDAPTEEPALVLDGHTFGYIPEGFELVDSQVLERVSRYQFSNGSEEFVIGFSSSDAMALQWNSEDGALSKIELNGIEAYWKESENGYGVLFWTANGQTIYVQGNIGQFTIKNIAKNIS